MPDETTVFTLRAATADDVPLILDLIRALGEFERLAHAVVATETDLRATLFGTRPQAEVILAFAGAEAVGFALFFHNYSTFLGRHGLALEDLFVRPAWRGRGLGRLLLAQLARVAIARDCGRFEWNVLDWNEGAVRLYRSIGATPMDEWTTFRLTGDALARLAAEAGSGPAPL